MTHVLHIDASCRHEASDSRALSKRLLNKIKPEGAFVTYRDVSRGMQFIDDEMIESFFVPPDERTDKENEIIALSDEITKEILAADILVIGIPVYNFSMPAVFKAWCDLAARVGVTFRYSEHGPVGLLENKKAYVAVTSGGMPIGGDTDFLTPWLRQYLKFIGIQDVTMIGAQGLRKDYAAESIANANKQIDQLDRLS